MKPCGFTPQDIKFSELFPWFPKKRRKKNRSECISTVIQQCGKSEGSVGITRAQEGKPS